MKLTHKGYGRIYVDENSTVGQVEKVIQEIDDYEFSYMPKGYVASFSEYPKVIYTHKFSDMNMDRLTATCWSRGIKIWVFDAGFREFSVPEIGKPDDQL